MEVEIGKEGLKFENGAFTYYGVSALTLPSSGEFKNYRKRNVSQNLKVTSTRMLTQLIFRSFYLTYLCHSVRVCLQCTSLQCQASVTPPGIPLIQLRLQARPATVPTTLSELSPTCRSYGCVGNKCLVTCSTNQCTHKENSFYCKCEH